MIDASLLGFLPMGLSGAEVLIIGVIAVLLFGKNLPEVGRNLGRSFADFNRSLRGLQDEFRSATRLDTPTAPRKPTPVASDERVEATAPKFRPPPAEEG